jgi:pantoate--beta-alanine ligase
MRTIRKIAKMQRLALEWRRERGPTVVVPTMGYLHEGHQSLVCRARKKAGEAGKVVVTIFVNRTQFGPGEDYRRYPRDERRDLRLCRECGADVVFLPDDAEMYDAQRGSEFSSYVEETALARGMEADSRPMHFKGVATVVAKLFNIVMPDIAVFGAKDFQQAAVIRRMARDLNFPVKIDVAPTVREADGLAMSSRNAYLTPDERAQATVLIRALGLARDAIRRTESTIAASRLKQRVAKLVSSEPFARLDYVEFFDPDTLKPIRQVGKGAQMALAVFFGKTRLIDNGKV